MKKIAIDIQSNALGDLIAFIPYANKYAVDNKVEVTLIANLIFSTLFEKSYPDIKIVSNQNFTDDNIYDNVMHYTHDMTKSLQSGFAIFLGYEIAEYIRPKIDSFKTKRPIQSEYVTFSVHSTAQLKYWNAPGNSIKSRETGENWNELCNLLRKKSITPVCLSQYEMFGNLRKNMMNGLPKKAVKKIGLDLKDVINYIEHSKFYIGPSTGLAWVAHALGKPVVMISNFTDDWNEFDLSLSDYKRITNKSACHGCWKEGFFDKTNWASCPKYEGTERQFECHTSITPNRVFEEIQDWLN